MSGVADAMALHYRAKSREACAMGQHAWVPWLLIPGHSYQTWCAREGCDHQEQYDL